MPVAKLFSAPYVQLCESAPTTSSPGSTSPCSGSTVWQMPPCPTSKYHLIPISCENSRVSRPRVALAASFAGWKWSCVTATRSGSQIFSAPICSRMILPAGGMVRSCPIAKSTLASTRSPGLTLSRPDPVDDALARDVGCGAVHGFEEATTGLGVEVGRGCDAHPADQLGREVAEDVPEEIPGDDDLELARVLHQLHGRRIHEEMARL